ncbi:LRR receptor-like serine/threonine-protein kinase GHR1 [Dendrobium catenatum]|uniref:Putative LRR receptor-like serine/threonine-protein kinase n=1 Tax=Dendrobium catenatum TaxID=906689 RepID=A0A2I0X7H7_9ASPA|nr:LRR receptor-like serine/threonine-protein kinase GHR1 [Dendrobium catenatum]PKU83867.1 putative LRR receptor-like serine/threonine-protein kinase [Dendrobium catenatum]
MRFFGGTLTLILLLLPVSSQLPSQDIMSLLAFKKGITHDPTGYISDSWNEESIDFNGCPSSWNGIVCNGDRVAGIVLDNLGISGTVDLSVFGNLTTLLKLSMANNNLSGTLPGNLGDFKSLKYLDISCNVFSGEIPKDIEKLQSIQNLSLAGNGFSGPLPDSIGDVDSVRSLDMSHNHLSGSLPSSLKGLRLLVSLNLSFNAFEKGIPSGLDLISSLESIDFSWNRLDGDVDWEFLMQTSVLNVDFSGNSLTSSNANEMKFLSQVSDSVKYLNLSHNQLTGSLIDGGELSTFGSLRVLDLSYNRLSGPLPGFDYVYDLEILRLGNNEFTGFLPNGLLKGDTLVLNELDLSANNLSGHIGLITSTTLRILNLSSNAITGELPLLTGSCTTLDFSKNQISGNLSVTAKWSNDLEFIDLSQNQLKGPIPEVTSQFLRLNYLNLSHNTLLNTLPEVLVQYPKLTILDLSSNQFSGPILPDLLASSSLHELHLQNNLLTGEIKFSPSSPNKPSVQVLNLANNHFNGVYPDDFAFLTGLQLLDISANNFSGNLPPTITKLISLNSLDISQNHFSGPLPTTLPSTLIFFNASYNDLSGIVPQNLRKFPDSSFHPGNSKLLFPGGSPGSGGSSSGSSTHKPIRSYIKAVIIVACVAFILLILIFIFVQYKRTSSRSHSERVVDKNAHRMATPDTSRGKGSEAGGALVVSAGDLITPRKESSSEIIGSEEKMSAGVGFSPSKNSRISWSPDSGETYPPENLARLDVRSPDRLAGDLHFLDETITLTPEELSRAPAEVLGRSSHGTSYRATLDNGLFLTVKWLREGVAKPKKDFTKEAKKFANIRHPNVVGLRGYYWGPTQHEKLILSDYISPGSLASFLYDRPGRRGPPLTWAQRLKIAVDVARGLNYLHFDRAMPHGNLKTTNILLDGLDLNARVSDYCLHRLMTPAGTTDQIHDSGVLGYCAPELAGAKKPTPSFKSDTYAFGVVLLELITGKCAGDVVSGDEGGIDLTDWVRLRVAEGRGSDCFDAAMAADISNSTSVKGMKEMLGIALRCIRPVSERPGIKSVYEDLSSI